MASNLSASQERLKSLIDEVESMQRRLDGGVRGLNQAVDGVASGWKGEAATQYSETQRRANLYADKLSRQLKEMEEVLKSTKNEFGGEEARQVGDYKAISAKSPISDFV